MHGAAVDPAVSAQPQDFPATRHGRGQAGGSKNQFCLEAALPLDSGSVVRYSESECQPSLLVEVAVSSPHVASLVQRRALMPLLMVAISSEAMV